MPRLVLRVTRHNRYSWTPLLVALEARGVTREWEVVLVWDEGSLVKGLMGGEAPLVLAYSFMTFDLYQVKEELERIRVLFPHEVLLVAGGPHPSGDPQGTLEMGFHYVFVGEGEETFVRFLDRLLVGEPQPRILRGSRVPSLDFPCFPRSFHHRSPIELTRGCSYGCKFCQVSYLFGFTPRHKPVDRVLSCIREGEDRSFVRFITPDASSYLSRGKERDLKALEAFFKGLKGAGVDQIFWGTFPSEVRPEGVTPPFLELVKKYCNNKSLTIGAQSGSEERLRAIGRGHGVEEIRRAARWAREYGFTPHLDFIFGFPGERENERRETMAFIEELVSLYGARIHAHCFIPLPGTPYERARPEPLSRWLVRRLGDLSRLGVLDGSWQRQAREVGIWG